MDVENLPGPLTVLSPNDRKAFLSIGRQATYARDEALMRQGEEPSELCVIVEGRVRDVATSASGKEVLLAVHGPGDFLGDLGVLDGGPRTASVIALEDVVAVRIPGPTFRATLPKVPPLTVALLQLAAHRLRRTNLRVIEQVADDTSTRLARRLLEVAARHSESRADGGLEITMQLTQDQLASWVGATREATAKALSQLRKDDLVETGRRSLVVLDVEGLRDLAGL